MTKSTVWLDSFYQYEPPVTAVSRWSSANLHPPKKATTTQRSHPPPQDSQATPNSPHFALVQDFTVPPTSHPRPQLAPLPSLPFTPATLLPRARVAGGVELPLRRQGDATRAAPRQRRQRRRH
eukprot:1020601-Pleurochrysis_carterae.AAC.1